MKIYRLHKTDMIGFTIEEKFYLNLDKALNAFDIKVEEYRQDENLAKKEAVKEAMISSEPLKVKDDHPKFVKYAMACLWYKCSYEYDEWDITVEHLELEEIKLEE